MTSKTWNSETARQVFAKFTHIAEEMLEQAAPSNDAAGTAGPQEVVDALEVIVQELETISAAIPAESSAGSEEQAVAPAAEAPVEEPVEEDPRFAKLQKQFAAQQVIIDRNELEKVAQTYAELYAEPKVQQAKYDEVISSKESSSVWSAKIEAISQFKNEQGINSYKPAQTTNNWLKPMTKVAKQSNGRMRL